MLGSFLLWAAIGKLVYFPDQPLEVEVQRGARIYALHKGIERTLLDDRAVLGLWFDGRVKRDVEYAVWVSPAMASRRLGYLQAKEKWSAREMQKRWEAVAEQINGKLTFIVQLAAMPTLGGLDMEPTSEADQAEVDKVRFLFTSGPGLPEAHEKSYVPGQEDKIVARYGPGATPVEDAPLAMTPTVTLLADWQMRDRDMIGQFRWQMVAPFGEPFRSEFEGPIEGPDFPLGDYFAAWYVVSLDLGSLELHPEGFDLRVFSRRKERIAHFTLLPR